MPRALINVHSFLQHFNPSKFTVYFSLLTFSILLSLRLDNRINISYWLVFLPLWIWKSLAIIGASVGMIVWLRNPDYRMSNSSYIHFKSMLLSLSLQLLLLMFELLVCDKLETRRHTWTLTFVPLLFTSLLSISVCVWSVKNGRCTELEFFGAVNILQIVLIALKLDNLINWSWLVVFIPSWILLCFAIIIILYTMIFAAIVLRSADLSTQHRRASIHTATSSSFIYLPLLTFIILLTSKLDSPSNVRTPGYFVICLPLFMALTILIRLSFGSKSGSLWWFGMRTDFCTFLLKICPCLKEYGNTKFIMNRRAGDTVAADNNLHESSSAETLGATTYVISGDSESSQNTTFTEFDQDQSGAKKLFQSLSQVFSRHKSANDNEKNHPDCPVAAKLSIDTPD